MRHGVGVAERDGARGDGLPSALGLADGGSTFPGTASAGLSSGVGQLNAGGGALRMQEAHDAREELDVFVLPDAGVVRRDTSDGFDGGSFGADQAGAAHRAAAEMDEMPVIEESIVGAVLAHGRDGETIAQGDFADGERR